MKSLDFTVLGRPVTQGSLRAFKSPKTGQVVVTHDRAGELRSWRHDIATVARAARDQDGTGWNGVAIEPLCVWLTFEFTRPPSHLGARGDVLPSRARDLPGPDLDKLVRAALDGMTGTLYDDDKRVAQIITQKRYGTEDALHVRVARFPFVDSPGDRGPRLRT